jgi:hypothetical protein
LSAQFPQFAFMTAVEERRLKGLLKTAVAEVLEERGDLLRESFEETALVRAIQPGEKSPLARRKKIKNRSNEALPGSARSVCCPGRGMEKSSVRSAMFIVGRPSRITQAP